MKNLDPPKTWQDYRELMGKAWAKSVMAVLDLARICAEADANLNAEDFLLLEKSLPFGRAKMSMLRQIGADARLFDKDVMARLSTSYSIIYQVHLLNDHELKHAIESGLLRPDVRRDQIEQLRLKRAYSKLRCQPAAARLEGRVETSSPTVETDCEAELVVFGELLLPRNFKRLSELHDSLLNLVRSYGIDFVPRPGREARLIHAFEEKSALYERFIADLEKERRARNAA